MKGGVEAIYFLTPFDSEEHLWLSLSVHTYVYPVKIFCEYEPHGGTSMRR